MYSGQKLDVGHWTPACTMWHHVELVLAESQVSLRSGPLALNLNLLYSHWFHEVEAGLELQVCFCNFILFFKCEQDTCLPNEEATEFSPLYHIWNYMLFGLKCVRLKQQIPSLLEPLGWNLGKKSWIKYSKSNK